MDTEIKSKILRGGEFLVKESKPEDIFTPEEFSEDQKMVIGMIQDFLKTRIHPNMEKLEGLDIKLTEQLLFEMGELGILGIPFPEEYGGSQMDFVTNVMLTEYMSEARSFALSFGAHTSIGMLPILYFGTEEQKSKYLPPLVQGVRHAAYCLTEPGSGSDALGAKTNAKLSEDGKHYILNGQKMWITNAGFADVFTVFAKIDGKHFTGFIVERGWDGVTIGAEEKKLGIKGSSTCQVFFENVKVPVENVLGKIGEGHQIAFNILNIGRIKLGAGAIGASKLIANNSIMYARDRKQFGQSIANFGAIKYKLSEQATRIYVNESACYRASHNIKEEEEALLEQGKTLGEALLGGAEEYSIECAILKVTGSECLDYCVDEGLQIYGGMGYSEEAPMAGAYRDARINRIFEGTNEINRMLSVNALLKKAMKGHVDLLSGATAIQKEIMSMPSFSDNKDKEFLGREKVMIQNMKKAFLLVAGATVKELMMGLKDEQEILMNMADMLIDIYLAESALLRTEKIVKNKPEKGLKGEPGEGTVYIDMTQVFLDDAMERVSLNGRRCLCSWAEGDMKRMLLLGLKRFTKYDGINSKEARRRIADKLIEEKKYCF